MHVQVAVEYVPAIELHKKENKNEKQVILQTETRCSFRPTGGRIEIEFSLLRGKGSSKCEVFENILSDLGDAVWLKCVPFFITLSLMACFTV